VVVGSKLTGCRRVVHQGYRTLLSVLLLSFWVLCHITPAQASSKVTFKPEIKKKAYVGKPFVLDGMVAENDDLEQVYLFYRPAGKTAYTKVKMSIYKGFRYKATLPASILTGSAIEFYVLGVDLDKKQLMLYAAPTKPASLKVHAPQKSKDKDKDKDKDEDIGDGYTIPDQEGKIFSASRKEQLVQKAPGVVTVITEEEIRAAGFRDLISLLRYIVGFDVNYNGLSPDIGLRGINPRLSFGDKIVVLVDGHNMSFRQLNRNSVPVSIDMIKQVEVIRGPGSTLWGANALSGVINIITKSSGSLKGFSSTAGGSPLSQSYFVTLQGGQELIGGLTFRGSFSLYQDNQGALLAPIKEFLTKEGIHYTPLSQRETNQFFYGQLSWRGFNLSLYQNRYSGTFPLSNFSVIGGDETNFVGERYIAKLSWVGLIGRAQLLVYGSYDYYGFGPTSQYEANPISPQKSESVLDGASDHFGLYEIDPQNPKAGHQFKGYFPLCHTVRTDAAGSQIPCIVLVSKPTLDSSNQVVSTRTCQFVKSPNEQTTILGEYPIPVTTPKTSKFCAPSYQKGQYTRAIRGFDHRFLAGIQLSVPIVDTLYLSAGVDFEYLSLVQIHSPDVWSQLNLQIPEYTNIHFSAFAQLQYTVGNVLELTAGARVDYDQIYGVVATPRAAVVWTPGGGFFAKALYGNAFKAPAYFDLFYSRRNETYGNPNLRPESVHTFELQVGWIRNRLMAVSVNGFYSRFSDLIYYAIRNPGDPLKGLADLTAEQKQKSFPDALAPDGSSIYEQRENSGVLNTYGGELEIRLFPIRGLNIRGGFGVFFGEEENQPQGNYVNPLNFAARWTGSLQASYAIKVQKIGIQVAVGALFVGPKVVPNKAFNINGVLPEENVSQDRTTHPLCTKRDGSTWTCLSPTWGADNDPTTETPMYVHTYATLQFLRVLGHMDVVFRVSNFLNADIYDANDELLMPQKKLDFMAWIRLKY